MARRPHKILLGYRLGYRSHTNATAPSSHFLQPRKDPTGPSSRGTTARVPLPQLSTCRAGPLLVPRRHSQMVETFRGPHGGTLGRSYRQMLHRYPSREAARHRRITGPSLSKHRGGPFRKKWRPRDQSHCIGGFRVPRYLLREACRLGNPAASQARERQGARVRVLETEHRRREMRQQGLGTTEGTVWELGKKERTASRG